MLHIGKEKHGVNRCLIDAVGLDNSFSCLQWFKNYAVSEFVPYYFNNRSKLFCEWHRVWQVLLVHGSGKHYCSSMLYVFMTCSAGTYGNYNLTLPSLEEAAYGYWFLVVIYLGGGQYKVPWMCPQTDSIQWTSCFSSFIKLLKMSQAWYLFSDIFSTGDRNEKMTSNTDIPRWYTSISCFCTRTGL